MGSCPNREEWKGWNFPCFWWKMWKNSHFQYFFHPFIFYFSILCMGWVGYGRSQVLKNQLFKIFYSNASLICLHTKFVCSKIRIPTLNSFPLVNSDTCPHSTCPGDSMVSSLARGALLLPSPSTSISSLDLRNWTTLSHWQDRNLRFSFEILNNSDLNPEITAGGKVSSYLYQDLSLQSPVSDTGYIYKSTV